MACKTCGQKNRAGSYQQREAIRNQQILANHKASNGGTNIVGGATSSSVKEYVGELDRLRNEGS